ncbi:MULTISPECIES: hypothetical protein [unclassified Pseudomonas]|uniref:hypothetical protein n=1 Tax=unclassified Pseudomonas TaxID=196821 RepID=UPI0016488AB5|nr:MULTISPECIES: hypothetical protein [unclassified Pseudomonas]MBC3206252.1 hypothetical protein [Pseudomonas sp. SWRI111]MBC3775287.1 hypothetical protein [Pseudomonas sp. SWRI99]
MGVVDSGMAESGGYCPTSKGNTVQTVGVSLLAIAVCQAKIWQWIDRDREQAHSYKGFEVLQK